MLKRTIAFCLMLVLMLTLLPFVQANSRGVSITNDSTFFSKFKLSGSGLEKVKSAVDKGDYTTAKKELLSYYQTVFTAYETAPFSAATDTSVFMAMNNVWAFSENYITGVNVTSTSYEPYTLDLGGNLKGIYVLDQIYATTDGVGIATTESSTPPELSLYSSNGTLLKTIKATEDTAVRPGKDLSAGLGSSTVMFAKHWPDTKNSLPFSSATTRCYIRFDTTEIPTNAKTAKLTVYCKRSPGNADKVLVEDSLYLCVFQSYCTNWSEDTLTWDSLVAGNYVGHYSYDGLSGGFDWKKPKGTPSEWLNYNTRFYEVRNLVIRGTEATDTATRNSYMNKAKSLVLDFINDAGANTPKNRALEPANRLIEFPFIYQKLICGGYLTADENVKILSWLYDDTTDQYNGAYTVFSGATATPKSNLAYTNWGLWHLTGFYSTICYFPEFNESASWRSVYDARLGVVMGAIIKEDGSYNEVTYGYPGSVISWCATLKNLINQFGDQSANAEMFSQKMLLLTKYLIDCSLPNGKPPFWGEGGPAATKSAVNTTLEGLSAKELQSDLAKYLQNYLDSDYGIPLENMVQYDGIQLVVDRTGRSSSDSMIFMNAKSAGSHSHRDALALLLHYDGRNLLSDTGMTSYDSGHQHFAFQRSSTRSHNTIEMDGIAQTLGTMVDDGRHQGDIDISGNSAVSTITSWSTASNPNLSSLKVEGTTSSKATHSTTFTHSRDVSFLKELGSILIVTDKVEPQDSASHTYTQNWHAAPYSNATIAKDAYLTGNTAYSSGPNLIIAQASTSGITASLQTGYDSSTPATPTKYFEYKQTASGAVTYQTVIYPVSEGVSATVQPKKVSMSNTKDTQAMAMEIAVTDTGKPNLSKIFHYHSFEDSPSQRSFGSYSTNAMTAMTALDQNGKVYFASLANGSSLTKNGKSVLSATASLTDLTAVYDNGVLRLYSEDLRAQGCDYTLNFDSQKVTEVYLNDNPMSFTQSTDGTVETAPAYVLMDFTSDSLAAEDSHWSGMRATTDVDQSKGILSGTINGGDPYISMTDKAQSIGYEIKQGDVIEIRMKTKISEGTGKGIQVFFRSDDTAKFAEASSCKSLSMEHATGRYYTIQLPFNASAAYIGTTIDKLRIDVLHLGSEEAVTAKYEIDYIYLGPKTSAPSASAKEVSYLFFDFTNKRVDEERYATETYGGYSFDSECWGYNPSRNTAPVIDQKEGTLSIHIKEDNTQSYVQTTTQAGGLFDMPLYYLPKAGDTVQVRLRFENCIATSTNPTISLYYIANDSAEVTNDHRSGRLGEEAVNTGKDIVVQFTPSNGFLESDCINAVRFTVSGVADDGSGQSRIVFDFFYIGSEEHLPLQDKLYFGFDNQEVDQERYNTLTYGGYNFDLGCWGTNVSRAQIPVLDPEKGTLTVQITEGSNGPYFQTTTGLNNLNTRPLSYIPGENDLVQLRVKFRNCKGSSPNLCLYYMKDGGSVTSNHSKIPVDPNLLDADQFAVFTFAVPDGFTTGEVINSIRITASGVSEKVTGQAQIEFDYIYIGPEKDLPTPRYTVTFLNGDGSVLHTLKVHKGETVTYTGETPTKAFDNSNHYTFNGWDKALTDIKADITVTPTFTAVPHSYTYAKFDGNSHSATCSCGYHKIEGHNFVYKATKNPSTSATGSLTGTCSICSETATVTLPKLNTTDYTKSVTKAPTCTATGTDKYTWKTTTYGTFSFDVTTKAKGHTSVTDKAVAPTCTATGLTEGAHCSVCNEVLTAQTIVAALGHSYTYKASKDPTTSATGTLTGTCSKCNGTTTVTLPKLNTTDYTKTTAKAPTCTETGTDSYKWKTTTYGTFSFTATISAKGHTSVTDKALAPTCTATGLTEGAHCSVCSAVLTAQTTVAALGHSYNNAVTAPTCTAQGYTTHTCSRCSDSYKDSYVAATGHSYTYKATKNPTTSATGTLTGTCSKCNGTTTVTLPKLNTTDYTKTTTKAPTCTETGTDSYKWKTTTYGAFSFNVTTKAKGHTSVTDKAVAPTCTATGLTEGAHCSVCNEVLTAQTVVEAFGHSYNSGVITTEPTCTESGVKTYTCTRCKDSKTETLSAKGHKEVVDKAVAATCTERGLTEGKHCSVCNTVFTAQSVVEALGHTVSDGYCTVCGQKYTGTLLDFIANSRELNFSWTVNKHATAPTFDTTGAGYANGQISAPGGTVSTDIHIGMEAKNNRDSIQHKIYSENEIFQLRVKLDVNVSIPENSQTKIYFKSDAVGESVGYSESYMAYTAEAHLDEKGFYIISIPVPEEYVGQVIETVRIDFLDLMVKATVEGSYSLDYIYIGPTCSAPSALHSYIYEILDCQNHKGVCGICNAEEVATHLYVDGLCICGMTETREPVLDPNMSLNHSLNLASDISINFVVPASRLEGYDMSTVYVESVVENYSGEEFLGTNTVRMEPVANGSLYYFTLTGITAVQMNDTIFTVLYGEKNGQPYYSNVDLYSVAQYAYSQLSKPNSAYTLKSLCADLLRYGAKAQLYKDYRVSSLADGAMTEEHKSYLSDLETISFGENNTDLNDLANASITWAGKTLDLDSKVCIKFVFSIADYTGKLEELNLKVSYKDIYGEAMEVTVTEILEYSASRGLYAFSVDSLLASELREVVSVRIFEGDAPVSSTFQYSADTYGNGKNGTLLELCKALFAYSDSAKAYFVK